MFSLESTDNTCHTAGAFLVAVFLGAAFLPMLALVAVGFLGAAVLVAVATAVFLGAAFCDAVQSQPSEDSQRM